LGQFDDISLTTAIFTDNSFFQTNSHLTEKNILQTNLTRNAWQSLAYSQFGVILSLLSIYLWNTPTTDNSVPNSPAP